jgi:hypothetical protein
MEVIRASESRILRMLGRPHTNCVKTSIKTWDKRRSLPSFVIQTGVRTPKQHVSASYHILSSWWHDVISLLMSVTYTGAVSWVLMSQSWRTEKEHAESYCTCLQYEADVSIITQIHKLITSVWNTKKMPDQWKESIVVPVHKKGNETDCSNCRGYRCCQCHTKLYQIFFSQSWVRT